MRYESYSQDYEDIMLKNALQDVYKGFYIDIGANDPVDISVTKLFYDEGWSGLNIEPLKQKCLILEEKRPRDINLCIGISNKNEELLLSDLGAGSTFSQDVIEQMGYTNLNQCLKCMMTLTEVYELYCPSNQQIHFCKIDVEGFERQVLEGIADWNRFRPWIYVMESTEPGTTIPCYDKWEYMLLEHGYVCAYAGLINRYYVDIRKEWLIDRFNNIDIFLNNHSLVQMKLKYINKPIITPHGIESAEKNLKKEKYRGYYEILNLWLSLKLKGKSLSTYFEDKNYKTIAIYGMGEVGYRLLEELKDTCTEVKYAVDQDGNAANTELRVVGKNDIFEKVDVMVITATFAFDEIYRYACLKVDCPIVSIECVINYVAEKDE